MIERSVYYYHRTESIELFIEDQDFLLSYYLAPPPPRVADPHYLHYMRIRIQLYTLLRMRIRIRIQLLRSLVYTRSGLHFQPPGLHYEHLQSSISGL
jgi:hypothetical protein